MTSRRRGWIALGITAVAVVVLLLGLAGRGQAPDVTVEPVTRQTLDTWITSNGKVEPIDPQVLRARLATFVQRVAVEEGQVVRRGQLLLQLDTTTAAAQLAEARQSLLAAQRQLQHAQAGGPPDQLAQLASDLSKTEASRAHLAALQKSLEKLVAEHAATRDELAANQLKLAQADADLRYLQQKKQDLERQARFDLSQARLRIDQARAQISDLGQQVASARLLAPAAGTVYSLPVKAGDYVHVGDELVAIADLHHVRVRAYVDEVDLGSLGLNQGVEVRWDGLPGRVWTGRTEVIPKQVVPYRDRRVGEVLCSVQSGDMRLLPSTNVDVRIRTASHANILVVPRAAVLGEGESHFVFLVQGDRLVKRPVKVGIASSERFEIAEGLKLGDRVAVPGATNLKNGLEIHAVEGK
jgi:HlyD family secretion protein